MAIKQTAHIIRGLRKDFSDSKQPKEYAIDVKNIRITNREDSSLLSITNEKGTQEISLNNLSGDYLGHTTINDILVLFTRDIDIDTDTYNDYIYKINLTNETNIILFEGKLSDESIDHIEALGVYESEDIQKVYWVDGVSQPRMINIKDETLRTNVKEFDFIQELQLKETISVEKSYSSGSFNSGVIQYAFNYYNKNGQESNIVEVTPINYISYEDRGAAPNDYVSNSFKITINNIDTNFDYLRLYSIHRTALDAITSVKLVIDLKINKDTTTLTYIDTGIVGETVDPTELLFKGGEYIIPKTLAQKDGTLFFGNIEISSIKEDLQKDILNLVENNNIKILGTLNTNKSIILPEQGNYYYKYNNQLKESLDNFSYFKKGECYRLGIQFQDKFGKWSSPLFIKDYTANMHLDVGKINSSSVGLPGIKGELDLSSLLDTISKLNYKKIRPIIVYPNEEDRNVLCQGVLCPTVFNVYDRYNNITSNQSSWFLRPNPPYDLQKVKDSKSYLNIMTLDNNYYGELSEYNTSAVSPLSIASNFYTTEITDSASGNTFKVDFSKYGRGIRFKHNSNLSRSSNDFLSTYPNAYSSLYNAEIYNYITDPTLSDNGDSYNDKVKKLSSTFFIDQSVVTMHSPEIEYGNFKNNSIKNYKLRIVGIVPITSGNSDIKIQTSSISSKLLPKDKNDDSIRYPKEFVKYIADSPNLFNTNSILGVSKKGATANMGWKSLISGPWWFDELLGPEFNSDGLNTPYIIFPWHTTGSLNNDPNNITAVLKSKILYNSKFSYNNFYFKNNKDIYNIEISDLGVWDKNESILYLTPPKNYPYDNIKYRGDIEDGILISSSANNDVIVSTYRPSTFSESSLKDVLTSEWRPVSLISDQIEDNYLYKNNYAIKMRYASSPHIVISLENIIDEESKTYQNILPTLKSNHPDNTSRTAINLQEETLDEDTFYVWDGDTKNRKIRGVKQNVLDIDFSSFDDSKTFNSSINYGWLWLAELYRDDVINRFGGNYETANNLWYPAGKSYTIPEKGKLNILWTVGDTFYQRYDHIKTSPTSTDNENSILEVLSFMCETRINIDGRYDRNRGNNNLFISKTNFNLFNDAYNQKDNFFNYRIIDKDIADNTKFPNTIVWSKQKFAGADIDAWTNINMASSLDLDGTKGELTKLVSFKNEIFSFQPEAINHILFNSRVQIPTSDGVPIELTNAYKVDGARQLSSVGSSNPLAIKSTDRGIYYMDNITKGIYVFNGQQSESLSDKLGMSSWAKEQNIDSYKVNYDKINQDIYFINNDNCLSYSEKLGEFESFFDYNDSEIFNVKDGTYAIKSNKLYKLFEGNYNRFFDNESKPFWVTFTHNENPFNDKIYNTLEFRSDTYNYITKDEKGNAITPYWDLSNNSAFNTIIVENEYQSGSENLDFKRYTPSNLKRKFRIWRANIPRDSVNKRDRIRNTWTNITLKASNPNNTKTELHDLIVNYSM